jgi:hypothetical protein
VVTFRVDELLSGEERGGEEAEAVPEQDPEGEDLEPEAIGER